MQRLDEAVGAASDDGADVGSLRIKMHSGDGSVERIKTTTINTAVHTHVEPTTPRERRRNESETTNAKRHVGIVVIGAKDAADNLQAPIRDSECRRGDDEARDPIEQSIAAAAGRTSSHSTGTQPTLDGVDAAAVGYERPNGGIMSGGTRSGGSSVGGGASARKVLSPHLYRPTPFLGALATAAYTDKIRGGAYVAMAADDANDEAADVPRPASRSGAYSLGKPPGERASERRDRARAVYKQAAAHRTPSSTLRGAAVAARSKGAAARHEPRRALSSPSPPPSPRASSARRRATRSRPFWRRAVSASRRRRSSRCADRSAVFSCRVHSHRLRQNSRLQ